MSIKTLEKLVICHIDCSIWSGRKKLRPEDLRLVDGSELPPTDVASLGSKKICDPEALSQFERLKKEAQRLCEQIGVRFLGGYAVPEARIDQILPELDRIGREFAACKNSFLDNYDQVIHDWIAKHPDYAEAIRRAIAPVADIAQRLQFDYTVYRIQPSRQAAPLDDKINGMGHTLLCEVARDANELFERSVAGKNQISQRALNPLRRLHDKLNGLSFLDHRVQPMVDAMDRLFPQLPNAGPITGHQYHELLALILILSDPDKMKRHGEGQLTLQHVLASTLPQADMATEEDTHSIPLSSPNPKPHADPGLNPRARPATLPSRTPAAPAQPGSFYF
ncbi:DUF3150 domain-containing protein [Marinobacterium rhizophilum]|uniref:DUF3150 domain-containing protein n=1 Tax=Marinobacterium rhizophilum TaxID=420402 RepID=UPI003F945EF9